MNSLNSRSDINKQYAIVVILLTFVIPVLGFEAEHAVRSSPFTFENFGKWFIFSAVGIRLFLAGVRQTTNPAFTAKEIFHIDSPESLPIVRELGFSNLCFGLLGLISFFKPEWRVASAFVSGSYYGLAGVQHLVKKPVGANEQLALWTDLIIFVVLAAYVVYAL